MTRARNIAVIGDAHPNTEIEPLAFEAGRQIAAQKWALICGGLGGVMEAASKGAFENGGTTIGILPGYEHEDANPYLTIVIPTGLGHARNAVIAAAADGIIAVGGKYGTLSEAALGLKMGKPVVAIKSWENIEGVISAATPLEAVNILKKRFA